MNSFDFIGKLIGKQKAFWLSIFILGCSITFGAIKFYPTVIVTPDKLQQELQSIQQEQTKANTGFELRLIEAELKTLTNEKYQLKKLKIKGLADEDDKDRLIEVVKQIDSLNAQKDSLQRTLYKIIK